MYEQNPRKLAQYSNKQWQTVLNQAYYTATVPRAIIRGTFSSDEDGEKRSVTGPVPSRPAREDIWDDERREAFIRANTTEQLAKRKAYVLDRLKTVNGSHLACEIGCSPALISTIRRS